MIADPPPNSWSELLTSFFLRGGSCEMEMKRFSLRGFGFFAAGEQSCSEFFAVACHDSLSGWFPGK
jgi:hypothetical protein